MLPSSLRQKITFAYLGVALLILAVSLFTYQSLKRVEARILLSERISEVFETTMEIRRFERNYFLHAQADDLAENAAYLDRLDSMLGERERFALLEAPGRIAALRELAATYRTQIGRYAAAPLAAPLRNELEQQVHATGKELVAIAEALVQAERRLLQSSLATFRITLVLSVAGLALFMVWLGLALSRRVAQPLQQMEASVAAISAGRRDTLPPPPTQDSEIVSITQAFNHMLKELELRQKHLLRSEKLASLGTLLSGVAHELNNPLSNIWSSCQILQEELAEADPEHQRVLLAQIDEQCERARHIVSSLQDFARERHFGRERFALQPLLEQTLRFVKADIPSAVSVSLHIADGLMLDADRQRMQQVFLNLIKNALDAIPAGGEIVVAARQRKAHESALEFPAECEMAGDSVDISIRDSGVGMDAECLKRIFDPFFTTKDVGHGMGLGLFIVYQIIEEHEGRIAVRSAPGQGTTFYIRLPLAPAAREGQDAEPR